MTEKELKTLEKTVSMEHDTPLSACGIYYCLFDIALLHKSGKTREI